MKLLFLILLTTAQAQADTMQGLMYLNKVWVEQPQQRRHELHLKRLENSRLPMTGYDTQQKPQCQIIQDTWIDGTPRTRTVCP